MRCLGKSWVANMGKLDKLYATSPLWLQNTMVSTYGTYWHWARFAGNYQDFENQYRSRQSFTQNEWQAFQDLALKQLLLSCVNNVPYYRDNWSQSQKEAALAGVLSGLPLLEKEPLRTAPDQFKDSTRHPFPSFTFYTSGTSGTPIASLYTLAELRSSIALREVRSANWAGVSFSLPRATFSGRLVEPDPNNDQHVYRYNAAEKQVYFSAFHLKPATARFYIDALLKHKVVWMTGYAVSFYLLARFLLDQNLPVPPLKAIITTSEKVTQPMREVIESAFKCKVYEEYSTVETVLFASECEYGRLHVSPDAGVVEILRPDGTACAPGKVGEVVATCLLRSYQPLVRFRLGDLAAWDSEPCPCGRHMPVIKEVVGRIEDVITGPDGRQMVRFHGIFVNQPHVIEGQVIQESLQDFVVKVVPTPGFSDADIQDIQARMHQRLGENINVVIEQVQTIPRTSAGKFKAVISKVK